MNGKPKCHGVGNFTSCAKLLPIRFQAASACGVPSMDSGVRPLDNLSGRRTITAAKRIAKKLASAAITHGLSLLRCSQWQANFRCGTKVAGSFPA